MLNPYIHEAIKELLEGAPIGPFGGSLKGALKDSRAPMLNSWFRVWGFRVQGLACRKP